MLLLCLVLLLKLILFRTDLESQPRPPSTRHDAGAGCSPPADPRGPLDRPGARGEHHGVPCERALVRRHPGQHEHARHPPPAPPPRPPQPTTNLPGHPFRLARAGVRVHVRVRAGVHRSPRNTLLPAAAALVCGVWVWVGKVVVRRLWEHVRSMLSCSVVVNVPTTNTGWGILRGWALGLPSFSAGYSVRRRWRRRWRGSWGAGPCLTHFTPNSDHHSIRDLSPDPRCCTALGLRCRSGLPAQMQHDQAPTYPPPAITCGAVATPLQRGQYP